MSPEAADILLALGVALAAGFLVGAERQQRGNSSFAGVRTFPLVALTGAVGMLLGWAALAVLGVATGALVTVAYVRTSVKGDALGMSTEMAAVVTFALGALCTARDLGLATADRLLLVAAAATATLGLLTVKRPLHRVISKVSEQEMFATAKLLALAVIVLPVLPDQAMGPWGALNPRNIGVLAVLISAISFAGYAAIRVFGARRGLGITGLLGGLVSSTAVTLSFAARARARAALTGACAVAIVLASATMFPRMVVEVAAVSPPLAARAAWAFIAAGGVAMLVGAIQYLRVAKRARHEDGGGGDEELELGNPFSVWSALKFAALFVVILLVSHGASSAFADTGMYVAAVAAGVADVDAISLSIARLHQTGHVGMDAAVLGIGIAAATNTLTKIGIAAVLGSPALAGRVAVGLFGGLAAGAAVFLATA
jgi:uncharacterized membrane protein (DUF4010 family)